MNNTLIFSQKNIIGKSYKALISKSCKEFNDGGCTIKTFCIISFENKNVIIKYFVDANCTTTEREKLYEENAKKNNKSSTWSIKNSKIHIQNFTEFGDFEISENSIIGKEENNEKLEYVTFYEIIE